MIPQPQYQSPRYEVIVTDVRMPLGSMVVFMIKWTIAAIPALVVLTILSALCWGLLAGFIASMIALGTSRV